MVSDRLNVSDDRDMMVQISHDRRRGIKCAHHRLQTGARRFSAPRPDREVFILTQLWEMGMILFFQPAGWRKRTGAGF